MSLDVAPEVEITVREYAAEEGVSISELLARYFPPRKVDPTDPNKERLFAKLRQMQKEYGLPVPLGGLKSLAQLSAQWAAEDASLSEDDRRADREFWEAFNQRDRLPLQF